MSPNQINAVALTAVATDESSSETPKLDVKITSGEFLPNKEIARRLVKLALDTTDEKKVDEFLTQSGFQLEKTPPRLTEKGETFYRFEPDEKFQKSVESFQKTGTAMRLSEPVAEKTEPPKSPNKQNEKPFTAELRSTGERGLPGFPPPREPQAPIKRNLRQATVEEARQGKNGMRLPVQLNPRDFINPQTGKATVADGDPRFEVLQAAVKLAAKKLRYSDEAVNQVLSVYSDKFSIASSTGKIRSAEEIRQGLVQAARAGKPYEFDLTAGIRQRLYRAEVNLHGTEKEKLQVRVDEELDRIDQKYRSEKPQNDVQKAALELAKQQEKKAAIDFFVNQSKDVRNPQSWQENLASQSADFIEKAARFSVDTHPLYRFLPEEAKKHIVDFQIGIARGTVGLVGAAKGINDFFQDAATDAFLYTAKETGLAKELGIDVDKIQAGLNVQRKEEAKLWSSVTNMSTERIAKNQLAFEVKNSAGLKMSVFEAPNWSVKAGEITAQAVPFIAVGVATGGASLPASIAISAGVGGAIALGGTYSQTRQYEPAMKAAVIGAAQGAAIPLAGSMGKIAGGLGGELFADAAANTAFAYTMGKLQGRSDAEIGQDILLQLGQSGAFRIGGGLHKAMEQRAGKPLTSEQAVQAEFQKVAQAPEFLQAVKETVATSAGNQAERFIKATEIETVAKNLESVGRTERVAPNAKVGELNNKAAGIRTRIGEQTRTILAEWGGKNKVFTREQYSQARAELRQVKMYSGIPADKLPALIKIAGHHLEAGARGLTDFVRVMKAEMKAQNINLSEADYQKLHSDATSEYLTSLRGKLSEPAAKEFDTLRANLGDDALLQKLSGTPENVLKTLESMTTGNATSPAPKLTADETKFWNEKNLGLSNVIERALARTDLDGVTAKSVSETLVRLKEAIRSEKLEISGSLRDLVSNLGKSEPKKVSESLAELERAAEILQRGGLAPNTKVIVGAEAGQQIAKATGLPDIDVPKVEADVYYRTKDGVLHLDEVKDTFNALTTKLDESIKATDQGTEAKQFGRYGEWVQKGADASEVRQVTVVVRNSGPGFNDLLEPRIIRELNRTIGQNPNQPIIQVKDRSLSLNDLNQMYGDALKKLGDLKKQTPSKSFGELAKEHFGSLERAFETLGKDYGSKVGGVK